MITANHAGVKCLTHESDAMTQDMLYFTHRTQSFKVLPFFCAINAVTGEGGESRLWMDWRANRVKPLVSYIILEGIPNSDGFGIPRLCPAFCNPGK